MQSNPKMALGCGLPRHHGKSGPAPGPAIPFTCTLLGEGFKAAFQLRRIALTIFFGFSESTAGRAEPVGRLWKQHLNSTSRLAGSLH